MPTINIVPLVRSMPTGDSHVVPTIDIVPLVRSMPTGDSLALLSVPKFTRTDRGYPCDLVWGGARVPRSYRTNGYSDITSLPVRQSCNIR